MTKITLTVNEKARKEANLRLLKRTVDRNIVDIVGDYTATHVVLYLFHPETQSWEKSNIEGSLSLVQQQEGTKTKYALVILNRNSPENYCMELTRDFQLQQNDPYLIFLYLLCLYFFYVHFFLVFVLAEFSIMPSSPFISVYSET